MLRRWLFNSGTYGLCKSKNMCPICPLKKLPIRHAAHSSRSVAPIKSPLTPFITYLRLFLSLQSYLYDINRRADKNKKSKEANKTGCYIAIAPAIREEKDKNKPQVFADILSILTGMASTVHKRGDNKTLPIFAFGREVWHIIIYQSVNWATRCLTIIFKYVCMYARLEVQMKKRRWMHICAICVQ